MKFNGRGKNPKLRINCVPVVIINKKKTNREKTNVAKMELPFQSPKTASKVPAYIVVDNTNCYSNNHQFIMHRQFYYANITW